MPPLIEPNAIDFLKPANHHGPIGRKGHQLDIHEIRERRFPGGTAAKLSHDLKATDPTPLALPEDGIHVHRPRDVPPLGRIKRAAVVMGAGNGAIWHGKILVEYPVYPSLKSVPQWRPATNAETPMSATDWQQVDEYFWSGPGGWTICRVFVDGAWQFEL